MGTNLFNVSKFIGAFPLLIRYLPFTLYIVVVSLCFAFPLGLILTFFQLHKNKVLQSVTRFLISVIRGTPLIILLFIAYYGAPYFLDKYNIDTSSIPPDTFAIITFSISLSAFISEIIKSAYLAIDKNQLEAATSIGLPRWCIWLRILGPQALIVQLPNIGSLIITAIKQSSIMFTIGIMDIYQKAVTTAANNSGVWQLEIFLCLMFIYWGLAIIIDKTLGYLYKREKIKI